MTRGALIKALCNFSSAARPLTCPADHTRYAEGAVAFLEERVTLTDCSGLMGTWRAKEGHELRYCVTKRKNGFAYGLVKPQGVPT